MSDDPFQPAPDGHEARHGHTTIINECLQRLGSGDESARDALIEYSCDRLRRLARRMMGEFARVGRWAETDDVLQSSLIRLHRALESVRPENKNDFINFAAVQIRRELHDLARKYFGPEGIGQHHHSDANTGGEEPAAQGHDTFNPVNLAAWTEFHTQVENLPDDLRTVVDLHWYQDMSQSDIAVHLQVSRRTVIRRWRQAIVILRRFFTAAETEATGDTDQEPDV